MKLSLDEIASLCSGRVVGDKTKEISGVGSFDTATADQLVFINEKKYEKFLEGTGAGAVLCRNVPDGTENLNLVVVENPQLAFALLSEKFNPGKKKNAGVAATSTVGAGCNIATDASIGEFVTIGENATIGPGVEIGDGVRIESDCTIGDRTVIHQNVVIKYGTRIGAGCRIHPGVVIGADGFGLVRNGDEWVRIPQLGHVVIGDEVDLGANTTIDRGALGDTVISSGVKLDNLIQVGHNVRIGRNTVIAAHTAIAGSTTIGEQCEIGGCVGIMDHSVIGDRIKIGGGSVISGQVLEPGIYSSSIKAEKLSVWQKNAAWLRKLNELAQRVKKLEQK